MKTVSEGKPPCACDPNLRSQPLNLDSPSSVCRHPCAPLSMQPETDQMERKWRRWWHLLKTGAEACWRRHWERTKGLRSQPVRLEGHPPVGSSGGSWAPHFSGRTSAWPLYPSGQPPGATLSLASPESGLLNAL